MWILAFQQRSFSDDEFNAAAITDEPEPFEIATFLQNSSGSNRGRRILDVKMELTQRSSEKNNMHFVFEADEANQVAANEDVIPQELIASNIPSSSLLSVTSTSRSASGPSGLSEPNVLIARRKLSELCSSVKSVSKRKCRQRTEKAEIITSSPYKSK